MPSRMPFGKEMPAHDLHRMELQPLPGHDPLADAPAWHPHSYMAIWLLIIHQGWLGAHTNGQKVLIKFQSDSIGQGGVGV